MTPTITRQATDGADARARIRQLFNMGQNKEAGLAAEAWLREHQTADAASRGAFAVAVAAAGWNMAIGELSAGQEPLTLSLACSFNPFSALNRRRSSTSKAATVPNDEALHLSSAFASHLRECLPEVASEENSEVDASSNSRIPRLTALLNVVSQARSLAGSGGDAAAFLRFATQGSMAVCRHLLIGASGAIGRGDRQEALRLLGGALEMGTVYITSTDTSTVDLATTAPRQHAFQEDDVKGRLRLLLQGDLMMKGVDGATIAALVLDVDLTPLSTPDAFSTALAFLTAFGFAAKNDAASGGRRATPITAAAAALFDTVSRLGSIVNAAAVSECVEPAQSRARATAAANVTGSDSITAGAVVSAVFGMADAESQPGAASAARIILTHAADPNTSAMWRALVETSLRQYLADVCGDDAAALDAMLVPLLVHFPSEDDAGAPSGGSATHHDGSGSPATGRKRRAIGRAVRGTAAWIGNLTNKLQPMLHAGSSDESTQSDEGADSDAEGAGASSSDAVAKADVTPAAAAASAPVPSGPTPEEIAQEEAAYAAAQRAAAQQRVVRLDAELSKLVREERLARDVLRAHASVFAEPQKLCGLAVSTTDAAHFVCAATTFVTTRGRLIAPHWEAAATAFHAAASTSALQHRRSCAVAALAVTPEALRRDAVTQLQSSIARDVWRQLFIVHRGPTAEAEAEARLTLRMAAMDEVDLINVIAEEANARRAAARAEGNAFAELQRSLARSANDALAKSVAKLREDKWCAVSREWIDAALGTKSALCAFHSSAAHHALMRQSIAALIAMESTARAHVARDASTNREVQITVPHLMHSLVTVEEPAARQVRSSEYAAAVARTTIAEVLGREEVGRDRVEFDAANDFAKLRHAFTAAARKLKDRRAQQQQQAAAATPSPLPTPSPSAPPAGELDSSAPLAGAAPAAPAPEPTVPPVSAAPTAAPRLDAHLAAGLWEGCEMCREDTEDKEAIDRRKLLTQAKAAFARFQRRT